jgi:tripartite-type tricarboxylate transporter receptor subunit TctC
MSDTCPAFSKISSTAIGNHMKRNLLKLVILSASLAVAGLSTSALAQDKPTVKIMVGFPPGGSVDVVARLLAEKLRVSLDQNVIVENKPGAAGRIALGELKRANPDGNTLALVPSGGLVIKFGLRPRERLHGHCARDHI